MTTLNSGSEIRSRKADSQRMRARDLADHLNIREAQLVAAEVGHGTTRIKASPEDIMPWLTGLGEVLALTRNESCVIEKVGVYDNFHPGKHASMILNDAIDLRMFPTQWINAFAVEDGNKRSIQVFDAAGDAIHKVHLREGSDVDHWSKLVDALRHEDQSDTLSVASRKPPEAPKADPAKADVLRAEWAKMTDTHQFLRMTSKLKMNRLGAYRIVGEPMARQVQIAAVNQMFETLAGSGTEIMMFVGNRGCIEIHGGPFETLKPMGPWQNILDPGFNIHLRMDHIAEVWAVTKPTQRGDAVSVETFDAQGNIIFQMFGRRTDAKDHRPDWNAVVAALPSVTEKETA